MVKRRDKSYFYTENSNNDQLGVRCLSKFTFKDNVIQQRETVVLKSMPFQALSCGGGA